MKITHGIVNVSGENRVYLYVTVEDIYEFGKENFGNGKDTSFLKGIREYVKNNIKEFNKMAAVIVINGVIIGTVTLSAFMNKYSGNEKIDKNIKDMGIYQEQIIDIYNEKQEELKKEDKQKEEDKNENNSNKVEKENVSLVATKKPNKTVNSNKNENTNYSTTIKPPATSTSTEKVETKPSIVVPNLKTEEKEETSNKVEKEQAASNGRTIRFNNKGVISEINLEEYIIGVVAAEMPASFHIEALKAQAVVARTYAMKKSSAGTTLINSTSHQVYNSVEQMKSKWGSSYNTYYNKIKKAVNDTKGQVLKYNGSYIEALYFSMSNGKTELPSYVWSTNYPYLQVVSSSWDENISASTYTISMSYSELSSKLGVTVNQESEINILSKTAGDRVNEISVAEKIFSGTKIRSLLGLRSTDFVIVQNNDGVSITTRGFGHGVGMSQYGANGAAKSGMTYKQILNHYYSGASLVSI